MLPSNTPRDVDEVIEVQVLRLYLVTVTCDEVQSYLKGFPQMRHIQMNQDIHGLRIGNGTTAPTSPLVPSKVEGLTVGTGATCGKCPPYAQGTYRKNGHMIIGALVGVLKGQELALQRSRLHSVLKSI